MARNNDAGKSVPNQPVGRLQPVLPKGFVLLAEVSEHEGGGYICQAPVETLKRMLPPWNPGTRTDPEDPKSGLRTLTKSMDAYGIGAFPIVNATDVIEGCRRVCAADALRWPTMTVLFRPDAGPSMYAEMNQEIKKHSPAEKAETWTKNSSAVTYGFNRRMEAAVGEVGLDAVKKIVRHKQSVQSLVYWATRAYDYCQPDTDRDLFLRAAVELQIRHREQKALRDWVEGGGSAVVLHDRVMKGKSLKAS